MEMLLKNEVYDIIGAAMEVHNQLGSGFLEAVYQEALALEFELRHIPAKPKHRLSIRYKGRLLEKWYEADFLCMDQILVEIKAQEVLTPNEEAQLLNYMNILGIKVGLLINFGSIGHLEWKRMVL